MGRAHGQSIVELSLTLLLLLLLLLGTIDVGRAFFDYIQIRNAAFEGARYGACYPSDTSGIKSHVTQHGVPLDTSITVALSGSWNTVGGVGYVSVTTQRTFTPITTGFLQSYFGLDPFTMKATASMRVMT
jgi:Flp pilus assembly protein TadG